MSSIRKGHWYIIYNGKAHNWQLCVMSPRFRKRFERWNTPTKGAQICGVAFSYWFSAPQDNE
jgi:hypothetical protein